MASTRVPVPRTSDARSSSPAGSVRGLYVRSRPPSISGSVLDAPFAQFSLTPTLLPLPTDFPPAARPKKVYAHNTNTMYFAASSTISLRTARTAVVPVRGVRPEPRPASPAALPQRRPSWLKKMVPEMLKGDTREADGDAESAPLLGTAHKRSFSLRRPKAKGIENRPLPRASGVRHSRSFAGYVCRPEDDDDLDLDESMPEVLEALRVNAHLRATGYRYERVDAAESRDLEEALEGEVTLNRPG